MTTTTQSLHCWHRFLAVRMLLPWPGWGGCRSCWCGGQQLLPETPGPNDCQARTAAAHGPYAFAWSGRPSWLRIIALALLGDCA